MDLAEIRRIAIQAVFSDDHLVKRLVLKGGNALELVHDVISRGSVDIDLSMSDEFEDIEDTRNRLFSALRDRFGAAGFVVFDEKFEKAPPDLTIDEIPWWGGYKVEFKLLDNTTYERLRDNPMKMSRQAHVIDSTQGRRFRIDISKFEYCDGKQEFQLDGYTIPVYSLEMCAIEKLRAICQQMPEYKYVPKGRPRARDFYDIYAIVSRRGIDLALPENLDLCRCIFAAKRVPLSFLPQIQMYRDFHSLDWAAVQSAITGEVSDFDFYFDFVVSEIGRLQSLWIE